MSSNGRCTMQEYTKTTLAKAFADGTVDLESPFMVRDATDDLAGLQEEWTSDNLRQKKYKNVKIQYLNAKMAKIAMSRNGQAQLADKDDENAQAMEVLQPEIVDFTEYLQSAFLPASGQAPTRSTVNRTLMHCASGEISWDNMPCLRLHQLATVKRWTRGF